MAVPREVASTTTSDTSRRTLLHMQLILEADRLTLRWTDGTLGVFPYLWLRDADPAGFHHQTGERTFDLTSVPLDVKAASAKIDGDTLLVRWQDRDAPSRFPLDWARRHRPGRRRDDSADVPARPWRRARLNAGIPRFAADDLLASDDALVDWLCVTKRDGLSIVDGLADTIDAGTSIARRVGHLRETNFGVTFEVVSKRDPNNLAYTAEALPLHTDLTNQELPPGYQFLHCLANEADGGESLFCDGFAVAADLARAEPELFERLVSTTVPFRFHDADTDIRTRKSVITCDAAGNVAEICFNAHLADILDLAPDALAPYYAAYRRFMAMTRDASYTIGHRLNAGEMVVFDNRRVLHGRAAFEPGSGHRHLHGCYVDRADWDSRLRVLSRVGGTST